jgi:predicted metal-binding membrane protein
MSILTIRKTGCVTMTNTRTDAVPNGRALFFVFSGLVFTASAIATVYSCRSMSGGMEMPGGRTMSMMWMRMPGQTWTLSAAMFMLMWLAMMVAMMLPSALPMLLNFRQSLPGNETRNFGAPVIFAAAGYFLVWLVFGAAVYLAGEMFALAAMRLEWLSRMVSALSGAALMAAGAIQLTAWKMSVLRRCRLSGYAELQGGDALKAGWCHGLKQGAVCFMCCLALMLALLALGAMNLTVMILIAATIATEKLVSKPEPFVRIFGFAALITGAVASARSLAPP